MTLSGLSAVFFCHKAALMSRNDGEKEFSVMAFEVFKKRVSAIVSKAGASVRFHHEDDGRHFAHCSDGVTIIGNLSSPSVCVKWGSGHDDGWLATSRNGPENRAVAGSRNFKDNQRS